jgi:hypothetical protein
VTNAHHGRSAPFIIDARGAAYSDGACTDADPASHIACFSIAYHMARRWASGVHNCLVGAISHFATRSSHIEPKHQRCPISRAPGPDCMPQSNHLQFQWTHLSFHEAPGPTQAQVGAVCSPMSTSCASCSAMSLRRYSAVLGRFGDPRTHRIAGPSLVADDLGTRSEIWPRSASRCLSVWVARSGAGKKGVVRMSATCPDGAYQHSESHADATLGEIHSIRRVQTAMCRLSRLDIACQEWTEG